MPEKRGYILIARAIEESALWRDDPHTIKLFLWLVLNAHHDRSPKKYDGFEVQRGELVTSLAKISEKCEWFEQKGTRAWSRAKVCRMLEKLGRQGRIKLIADTYGTHIRLCNYESYQDPKWYKADNDETVADNSETVADNSETVADNSETVARIYNNVKHGKNEKKKDFRPTSDEVRLSTLLFDLIRQRKSNLRKPNIQKWSVHIDRLIRLDKRSPPQIEAVIRWSQADDFWQNNILSTEKLRTQIDRLELQMQQKPKPKAKTPKTCHRMGCRKMGTAWAKDSTDQVYWMCDEHKHKGATLA